MLALHATDVSLIVVVKAGAISIGSVAFHWSSQKILFVNATDNYHSHYRIICQIALADQML
jgi:hypothetical protein